MEQRPKKLLDLVCDAVLRETLLKSELKRAMSEMTWCRNPQLTSDRTIHHSRCSSLLRSQLD